MATTVRLSHLREWHTTTQALAVVFGIREKSVGGEETWYERMKFSFFEGSCYCWIPPRPVQANYPQWTDQLSATKGTL